MSPKPRGGKRPGAGRIKGSKNRAVAAREKRKAREAIAVEAREELRQARGKRSPLDILEDFMVLFYTLAADYQTLPLATGKKNPNEDPARFREWSKLSIECAKELAAYNFPKFRAVVVSPATLGMASGAHGAPTLPSPSEAPQRASQCHGEGEDGKVVAIDDPDMLTRIYNQKMQRFG